MEEISICLLDSISTAGLDGQQLLYLSQISGESKQSCHTKHIIPEDFYKDIPELAYREICSFYNENKDVFEAIEKVQGYNIWLYHHERLYNEARKILLKKLFIEDLVQSGTLINKIYVNNETEKILISKSVESDLIEVAKKTKAKSISTINKLKVLLTLAGNVFRFYRYSIFFKKRTAKSNTVIFHNRANYSKGKDVFYGELLMEYDRMHFSEPPSFSTDRKTLKISVKQMRDLKISYLSDVYFFFEFLKVRKLFKIKNELSVLKGHYQKLPLSQSYLAQYLRKMHSSLLIYKLVENGFSKFFQRTNYRSLILIDENSPTKRAVRNAGDKLNVKSIAYQHGLIGHFKPSYDFSQQKLNNFHLSDLTFVWGERDKEFLIHAGYSPQSIKVLGQIIANLELDTIDSKKSDSTTYLYCSQPLPQNQLRKVYLEDVLSSFSKAKKPSDQLILRFHPREKDALKLYDDIDDGLKENVVVDVISTLHKSLAATDVLITPYSAVAKEFALYNRPIITLDYLNNDIIAYAKDGLSLNCINRGDLENFMTKIDEYKGNVDHTNYTKYHFFLNENLKKDFRVSINLIENGAN